MEPDLPALKITAGVHTGALIRLDTADMLVIGSSDDCDVILADEGVSSHHCVLKRQGEQFFLRTIEGTFSLNGQQQDAGETVPAPPGTLVSIGSAELQMISTTLAAMPVVEQVADPAATAAEVAQPSLVHRLMRTDSVRRLVQARPLTAASMAVAVLACVVAVRAMSFGASARSVVDQGSAMPVAAVTTRSGAAIAHDVAEVLRLSGITCEAHYNGDGTVTVRGHLGDSQTFGAIVNSRAIREIVGLKRVLAVNLDQSGRSAAGAVDGTRIVSVVASADPYVVTADGSRYYVGAALPQGGRLAGVKEG